MRNPWIIAQLAIAPVLLVISVIGILGVTVLDAAELAFTPQGAIHSFAVFPGLILSLVVNAVIMRSHRAVGLNLAEKILLGVEFALIAVLLVFHFYIDPAGNTFGLAIITWPVIILLAVAIAIVAISRAVLARENPQSPPPAPPLPAGTSPTATPPAR